MGRLGDYGWDHQRERSDWDAELEASGPVPCRRCRRPVHCDRDAHLNHDGERFDLGHPDPGQVGKRPEHRCCNRSAGGREGNRRKAGRVVKASLDWDAIDA